MQTQDSQLIVSKEDYESIMNFLKNSTHQGRFDSNDAAEMVTELKRATVVAKNKLPADVVQLNSKVLIKEEQGKVMEITLVAPTKANISKRFISVLSPVGRALIGFRKGCHVRWNVPSGKKEFTILDVQNG